MPKGGKLYVPVKPIKTMGPDNWEYADMKKRKDGNPNKSVANAKGTTGPNKK